jgi:hypothetical protein
VRRTVRTVAVLLLAIFAGVVLAGAAFAAGASVRLLMMR